MRHAEPVQVRRPAGAWWRPGSPAPSLLPGPRPVRPQSRGGWRRLAIIVSLLLHAAVFAVLLLMPKPPQPELGAPQGLQMVFEQGTATSPQMPGPEPEPQAPMAAPSNPSPNAQPQAAPPPPAPEQPVAPPTPPTPPALIPPEEPTVRLPPEPQLAPPPPDEEGFLPPTPAPPVPAENPRTPPQTPPARPAAPRSPPHPPAAVTAFPRPMFNSLGSALNGAVQGSRQITRAGGGAVQPFAQTSGSPLGDGYMATFREWVERHKYYPEQAAEMGQEGTPEIDVTIHADGRVTAVDLRTHSGSPWLDLALQSMFRDARVPPFPPGTTDQDVTFHIRMTYSIRR